MVASVTWEGLVGLRDVSVCPRLWGMLVTYHRLPLCRWVSFMQSVSLFVFSMVELTRDPCDTRECGWVREPVCLVQFGSLCALGEHCVLERS